jgi:8-oxo-dGTP diphosphatase
MKLATLCYVRKNGRTLMVHRVKKANDMHQGKWNGLGGKLEPGETPEECARREILEESGLRVKSMELKGLLTFPAFAADEDWYAFVFLVDNFEGELIDSPEGDLRWVEDSELLALNLWAGDRVFLGWLERKGFFSAKFIYENGELVDYDANFYDG